VRSASCITEPLRYNAGMFKFVFGLWWLLGGLTAALALAAAPAEAPSYEPIPYPIWFSEPVDATGYAHALALDSADRPHLLFQDPGTRMLRYAVREESGWVYDDITVIPSIHPDLTFDLAIAPGDIPCLIYANAPPVITDPIDTQLVYGCRGDSGWDLAAVDDGGRTVSLVLDGDTPHIALVQELTAVYLTQVDGVWEREVVGVDAAYMGKTWLYLDGAGRPHVIFVGSQGAFEGVRQPAGTWTVTPFPMHSLLTLTLDAADRPWLLLTEAEAQWGHPPFSFNRLLLAAPDGSGGWASEMLREDYDWGIAADLAVSGNDLVHVAYRDVEGLLHYQWRAGDALWQSETPADQLDADLHLALGSDGLPRLSFGRGGQLQLATRRIVVLDQGLYLPSIIAP